MDREVTMESSSHITSRNESRTLTPTDLILRIVEGKLAGQFVKLSASRCTIGSGTNCTLRLRGKNVAAVECEITRLQKSNIIRCLSSNTLLNGQPFDSVELYNGDVLTVGPVTFEIIKGATVERGSRRREIRSQIRTSTLLSAGVIPADSRVSVGPIQYAKQPIEQSQFSITTPAAIETTNDLLRSVNHLQSSISREEQTISDWQGFGHYTTHIFADHSLTGFLNSKTISLSSTNPIPSRSSPIDSIANKEREAIRHDNQRNASATQYEELKIREIENNSRALENIAKAEAIAMQLRELTTREAAINEQAAEYASQKDALLTQIEQLQNDRAQLAAERQAFDDAGRKLIDERKQWLSFVEKTRSEQQHIEDELTKRSNSISEREANLVAEKLELGQSRETLARNLANNSLSEADSDRWHAELASRAHALGRYTTTIKAKSAELESRQQSLQVREQQLYNELSHLETKRQELDTMLAALHGDREQFEIERSKITFQQSALLDQILDQRDLVADEWARVKRSMEDVAHEKSALQKRRTELETEYRTKQDELEQRESELTIRLASIDSDRQALSAREDELRQLEHALNRQASNTASTSEEITADLLRLESERKGIQNQVAELEQKRADAESEVAKLESFRKAFADERLQWEEQQATWHAERIRLEEKLVAFDAEQREIDARFQEFELEKEKIELERAEMQKIVDERNEIERESLELKQAIEILEHRRNSLDSELADIQHKRPDLERTLAELERATAELNEISAAAREIQAALVATTSEYTEKQNVLQNLESELAQLKTEIANLRVEQDRLVAENEQAEELRAEEAEVQRLHAEEALTQRLKAEQALTHHSPLHLSKEQAEQDRTNEDQIAQSEYHASNSEDAIFDRLKNLSLLKSAPSSQDENAFDQNEFSHGEIAQDDSNEPPSTAQAANILSAFREKLMQEDEQESSGNSDLRQHNDSQKHSHSQSYPEQAVHPDQSTAKTSQSSTAQSHGSSPSQAHNDSESQEDSIDDYMQQLLQRMRGQGGATSGSSAPVIERRDRDPNVLHNPQTDQRRSSDPNSVDEDGSMPPEPTVAKPRREPTKASSQNIDMSAMREIANLSARSAVSRSMSKRTASKVLQHVMVGGASLAMSAVVLYLGQDDNQLITNIGYAGLGLSATWLAYALFVSRKLIFGEFTMSSLIDACDDDAQQETEEENDVARLEEAKHQTPNIFASITNSPAINREEQEAQAE